MIERPAERVWRIVLRNLTWNWAGISIEVLSGFLVAPILISHLGHTTYGIWVLIGALTGYFGLLDLGIRSSVGRFVAIHAATDGAQEMNTTVNSALALLGCAAMIALLLTVGFLQMLLGASHVPAAEITAARMALMLTAISLAVTLVFNVFDATLWGLQRFDLLNAIDIPNSLLRITLTVALIRAGHGIVALAAITLLTTVLPGLGKAAATFVVLPKLRLRTSFVRIGPARRLFGYGSWNFIRALGQLSRKSLTPALIAAHVGVAIVTAYSLAARLVSYATLVMVTGSGVLTPLAATLHARADVREQKRVFLNGGAVCVATAGLLVGLLIVLGPPFIILWVGPNLAWAADLLTIVAIGELMPLSQLVTEGLLVATASHRPLAWLNVAESLVGLAGATLAIRQHGVYGAVAALAACAFLFRGVAYVGFGCHRFGVAIHEYALRAVLVPALLGGLVVAVLRSAVSAHAPTTWTVLVCDAAICAVVYVATVGPAVRVLIRINDRPARLYGAAPAAMTLT